MSVIGEMWEDRYDQLKQQHIQDLVKFAEWLEREEIKAIGYNMWSTSKWSRWNQAMYYTTEQLIKRFLKDNI